MYNILIFCEHMNLLYFREMWMGAVNRFKSYKSYIFHNFQILGDNILCSTN